MDKGHELATKAMEQAIGGKGKGAEAEEQEEEEDAAQGKRARRAGKKGSKNRRRTTRDAGAGGEDPEAEGPDEALMGLDGDLLRQAMAVTAELEEDEGACIARRVLLVPHSTCLYAHICT